MKNLAFIRIEETTDKAYKVIIRESGYDLVNFKQISKKFFWIPKSVSTIQNGEILIQDWFYNKNISVDIHRSFMNSLSNS